MFDHRVLLKSFFDQQSLVKSDIESFNQFINHELNAILEENHWHKDNVFVIDERLLDLFKDFNLNSTNKVSESKYFLSTC